MPEVSCVERWLPIVGYEGFYEVSDLGRVRSVDRVVGGGRGPSGLRRRRGQIRALSVHPFGYPQAHLSRDGTRETSPVHKLVLTAFVGPCPEGMTCCHGPEGATVARLDNLRWDTPSENMFDRGRDGTDWQLNKERCPRKHLYVGPNLKPGRNRLRDGSASPCRECRACRRAEQKILYELRMGRPAPDMDVLADEKYEVIMRGQAER